jgi:arginyl-tRNA synthetase
MDMREAIRDLVRDAIERAAEKQLISLSPDESINIEISRTRDDRFGDYATNVAMVLAGQAHMNPRDLATIIRNNLSEGGSLIEKSEIAGPGFINFFLSMDALQGVLHRIHREHQRYGRRAPEGTGRAKLLLEFVSANPTGPLHVGHGRGAAVGDTLARLLRACGRTVDTEYYVNDAGNQMRILGKSVLIRYRELLGQQVDFPENHYMGEYIRHLAEQLRSSPLADRLGELPEEEAISEVAQFACDRILQGIKDDLGYFRVEYNHYFSEKSLHEGGAVTHALEELRSRGFVEDKDGAVWFNMEGEEDEKDRVLVRATGEPTYFAADAAYHENKFERGYETLIDIWGADHHGYVPRVRAAIEALGHPADALTVLLVQFVALVREGKKLAMSTRSGEFVTLREVLDEVGPDAARFFFLTKRPDSHLDFDLDLAKKQSKDNPVYYVQYAHARVASIFRIAAERGIDTDMSDPDLTALSLPEEKKIMKHLADFPDMLSDAADALEPHRITFYLMDLAELFHAYYHDNRVLTEDSQIKKARLYLVEAVRNVVANGLSILGVNAPNRM